MSLIHLAEGREKWQALVPSGSVKCWLKADNHQLLNKDYGPSG
jgi:hypothetical protein